MHKYLLPGDGGQPLESEIENNSIIIIGANGSGKSKLGAWMEQNNARNIHRVGAQRSLTFGEYIQQKSFEQASNLFLYGNEKSQPSKDNRYPWDGEKYNYTCSLLNDYENVLSALFAMDNNQKRKFIDACKEKEAQGQAYPKVPNTAVDSLKKIWAKVFPQRQIDLDDAKVSAIFSKNESEIIKYKARDMSDGERVALYLIAQCLCIPENQTIIIDEPEIHLHRSIMNRLWTEIENERQDCLFIYITHDTQFAAYHKQSRKIWVKSFDGVKWCLEEIEKSTLPEQLLLDIMGNRKHVLFVEGTAGSYDTKLYSEIYKDYYVVPCGSCSAVITQTKAMKANPQLHDLQCYGIIDRDYRSDYEIQAYKNDNIFTLAVAEVENLLLLEELLVIVNNIMAFTDESRVEKVKKHIIDDRFAKQINRQICESVVAELKYKLSTAEISKKDETEAKNALNEIYASISYDSIKAERENKFYVALESKDYKKVLSVFNCKSLSTSTGHFFELNSKSYCDFVIRQLHFEKAKEILDAIIPYLPSEIPIHM